MPTAAKKSDDEAKDEKAKDEKAKEPETTVETTMAFDGQRAIDTTYTDGVPGTPASRDATLAEQLAYFAPQVLEQAVRTIPGASTGTATTDGSSLTLTFRPL